MLYTSAFGNGLISARDNALFSTVIILSMAVTPFVLILGSRLLREEAPSLEGIEAAHNLKGRVLMIGFGRFGQIASQLLLAQRSDVSIIEADPNRIREAGRFGFKIFYGDGSRLDILHHSGADEAEIIMVCVDDRKTANRIVELVKSHFPAAKLMVRSYDRTHSIELLKAGWISNCAKHSNPHCCSERKRFASLGWTRWSQRTLYAIFACAMPSG